MTSLPDLTAAALSGTPDALPPHAIASAALAALPPDASRATTLLGLAGAVAVARSALLPTRPTTGSAPDPAPVDEAPTLSPAAALRARTLLGVHDHAMLPEWLAHARAAGRVLPPELVPAAIDLATATSRRDVRHGLVAVLGARGRWFAALDATTRHLVADVPHQPDGTLDLDTLAASPAWTDGTIATRGRWFEMLRAADPDAARELLARDWDSLGAALLARCTELLADGATLADEALAERAAAHASKPVVEAAHHVLGRLPGAARNRATATSVSDVVTVTRGRLLAKDRLTINQTATPEHLASAVAATPLASWTASGLGPAALVRLGVEAGEPATPVLDGWRAATFREGSTDWADALLVADGGVPPAWLLALASPTVRTTTWDRLTRAALADGMNIWPLRTLLEDRTVVVPTGACERILALVIPAAAEIGPRRLREIVGPLALRVEATPAVRDLLTAAAAQIDATDDLRPDLDAVLHAGAATVQDRLTLAEELT